jgi:UDP-2,3-diacylglucosamine hydrolase
MTRLEPAVALVCGAGSLPYAIADAAVQRGRTVVLFAIKGWADPERVPRYRHHWVTLGKFGRWRALAREEGCRQVVLIGGLVRPALGDIGLDWRTLRILPRLARCYRGGDNRLLSGIAEILEQDGFEVVSAQELAPDILVPRGAVGGVPPRATDLADIDRGLAVLAALGPFDIGQAVVVCDGRVLGIEAAEGTDQLLGRIAALRADGRVATPRGRGVLIKAPKRGQDRRFDLPAIGPATLSGVIAAGLGGIAVLAEAAVMAEPQQLIRAADAAGVFVLGIEPTGAHPR